MLVHFDISVDWGRIESGFEEIIVCLLTFYILLAGFCYLASDLPDINGVFGYKLIRSSLNSF